MIRTLLIIAGASLVLCLAALGGAAALGGRDLAANGWAWEISESGDDSLRFERLTRAEADAETPTTTRALAWTGSDTLTVSTLGEVIYVQGAPAGVSVTGPQALVDRVVVNNGALTLEDGADRVVFGMGPRGLRATADSERLRVVVTAPSVTRFEVRGSTDLSIRDYDQDSLTVDIAGSGAVAATGRTDRAEVDIAGAGDVDLSAMRVTDARVLISGSGDVRVGPTGDADIDIRGPGEVDLTTRPQRVNQRVSGSGEVNGG